MKKIREYLKNPYKTVLFLANHNCLNWVSDENYAKLTYRAKLGRKLDLNNPVTFNEKIQWLKLYDRNPEYSGFVDKYESKNIVKDLVGEEFVVPLLGVYDSFDEIDFDVLPNQFVIKTTHDSGGYVIVRDKSELNVAEAKKKIESSQKRNYYKYSREWPYNNVKPRIIIEEYIVGKDGEEMKDFKLFCFNGEFKFGFIISGRSQKVLKMKYFDKDFNFIPVKQGGDKYIMDESIPKPKSFDKMVELTKTLTKGFPFVRMDFIEVDDRLYVGEFTLYHWGGTMPFEPGEWDRKFGEFIELPTQKNKPEYL